MKKNIIITADDFGKDKQSNEAIKLAFEKNILKSTCLMTNMEGFLDAIRIIKNSKNKFDIGLHLNLIEGNSLVFKKKSLLTDEKGTFSNSFIGLLIKSFNKNFLAQVEEEFCAQIEKALKEGVEISYINSHVHTHSIPNIFKLVLKMCEKYGIKAIRTQKEEFYFAKDFPWHIKNLKEYLTNIIKNLLLNFFSFINKKTLKGKNIKTNENFIGVLYTANMDKTTILEGIKKIKNNSEIILHPTTEEKKKKNFKEFQTLLDLDLKKELEKENINLINWHDFTFMS